MTSTTYFAVPTKTYLPGRSYSHWFAFERLKEEAIRAGVEEFALSNQLTSSAIKNYDSFSWLEVAAMRPLHVFLADLAQAPNVASARATREPDGTLVFSVDLK